MLGNVFLFNLNSRGGMLHYSSQFANALTKKANVTVCIAQYADDFLYNNDVSIFRINTTPTLLGFILQSFAFRNHIRLLLFIYKLRPCIVHFMDNHPWYPVYLWFCKKMGITIYVTQHDPLLHSGENKTIQGRIAGWVNEKLRNSSDKLVVHGEGLKKDVMNNYAIPEYKIIAVPHGNYTFFTKWSKGNIGKDNYFLFFGRIVHYKGLDVLLDALPFITKEVSDFKLIIAGGGDISVYKEAIEKNKNHILVDNYMIPDEEVANFFEQCEFVVLPYHDATGSGIIPLSYAFSKPVIVSRVGELGTHVIDNQTGIILKENTPETLAKAIIWMLQHKKETQLMGKQGRIYSEEVLGRDSIITKVYSDTN